MEEELKQEDAIEINDNAIEVDEEVEIDEEEIDGGDLGEISDENIQ